MGKPVAAAGAACPGKAVPDRDAPRLLVAERSMSDSRMLRSDNRSASFLPLTSRYVLDLSSLPFDVLDV